MCVIEEVREECGLGEEEVSFEGAETGYQLLVAQQQVQKRAVRVGISFVDDFVQSARSSVLRSGLFERGESAPVVFD